MDSRKTLYRLGSIGALVAVTLATGCTSWDRMTKTEKGTTVGAGGGAVAGAVVGGPVGAVVGAGVGGVAGHEAAKPENGNARADTGTAQARTTSDPAFVRTLQQALDNRGYDAGTPDGRWGPGTEEALKRFQNKEGLPATGQPDSRTLNALGM
jgi:hypothetical protein